MATHYDTLGVRPGADQATIRAAYLAKARAHHPDRHVDAPPAERARAARTMRDVNAAWTVLSDPAARRDYDARLSAQARPSSGSASTATAGGRPAGGRPAGPGPAAARPASGTGRRPPGVHGRSDDEADVVVRGIRLVPVLAISALLLGIFVFTAFAATGDPEPPTTTLAPGDLAAGMCVRVERVLTVVPCAGVHDATVVSVVMAGAPCPRDTSVYTVDRSRVACLRPSA